MNRLASDLTNAVTQSNNFAGQDVNSVAGIFVSQAFTNFAIMAAVVAAFALVMFVWFLVKGESWDQRRLHLWPKRLPGGIGRRQGDHSYLEASANGPFRQKASRG